MLRQFGRLITFGALTAVLLLGLGGVAATTQPEDLTVKNLTVIESLTVGGLATLNQGLEVVGIIRSKGSPSLGNAAQLILDSAGVEQGRTYNLLTTYRRNEEFIAFPTLYLTYGSELIRKALQEGLVMRVEFKRVVL